MRAVAGDEEASEHFSALQEIAPAEKILEWKKEIEAAEMKRTTDVTAMDVMKNRLVKGMCRYSISSPTIPI